MPAKPKSPFPNPAATLPGEADILANVLADLSDHDAKLVYADWLEDRDDKRASVLRRFITAHRAGKELFVPGLTPKPWRDLLGLTLMKRLRDTTLAPHTDKLLAFARPAISYKAVKAAEASLPVGASKFGGRPDLPAGLVWPKFEDEELSFFGQFNLAELQASPVARELPPTGVLSVFSRLYRNREDVFRDGSWRLFHFPDESKLARRESGGEVPDKPAFESCRLEFAETLTLPDWDSPWEEELTALGISGKYGEPYSNVYYALSPGDHILGHSYPIQSDFLHKKTVRHLLTISSNGEAGWKFPLGGAFYFTLPDADLKAGRLECTKMIFDCG